MNEAAKVKWRQLTLHVLQFRESFLAEFFLCLFCAIFFHPARFSLLASFTLSQTTVCFFTGGAGGGGGGGGGVVCGCPWHGINYLPFDSFLSLLVTRDDDALLGLQARGGPPKGYIKLRVSFAERYP